jgi:transcriptional regulator with XRE-family HTH domain
MVEGKREDLFVLRKALGLTQQEMADRLDMALRAYQSIEAGESECRLIHRLAAERVGLMVAVDKKDPKLVPDSVRDDALELVRIGQAIGRPEYTRERARSPQVTEDARNTKFRGAYGVIGELVLLASALDHQLNHVLIEVLPLVDSPLLESVIGTLDSVRKLEMLKTRSRHITQPRWRKPILSYVGKLETVSKWRNIAAHTPLIPDDEHDAVFVPTAAAKLLKTLRLDNPVAHKIPIADLRSAITTAEAALGEGLNIIQNFRNINAARISRFGK